MREPAFWWRAGGFAAALLKPAAWCYGGIAARRMRRGGTRAGIPVVCIGNLTLGGTGKTPAAIAVAALLKDRGETPYFLSRGYGGRLAGPVRVDPALHDAHEVGDEPLLLARAAPTIVSRDRVAGAELARAQGASVIVMDDGLQNPSLEKNLSIAAIDGLRGIGNACVFPAGPLRAPLAAQLERVDALLVVGEDRAVPAALKDAGKPVLRGALMPDRSALAALAGHRVLAFAGIGHPEKFFATLTAAGIAVAEAQPFPDHHAYSDAEARALISRAEADGLLPVTTEKDLVRLSAGAGAALAARTRTLPVTLAFEDVASVRRLLDGAFAKARTSEHDPEKRKPSSGKGHARTEG